MSSKVFALFCFLAVCQLTFSQVLPTYAGNSVVENTVVVNSGLGNVNSGFGNLNSVFGNVNSGLDIINSGLAVELGSIISGLGVEFGGPGYLNLASISGSEVLPVTSYGPIYPSGLTVLSNNEIEGVLLVNGEVPFLSAVAFEGSVASGGSGAASCGCGDGNIGIVSENFGSSLNGVGGLGGLGLGNRLGARL